jgi:hypothetical protein
VSFPAPTGGSGSSALWSDRSRHAATASASSSPLSPPPVPAPTTVSPEPSGFSGTGSLTPPPPPLFHGVDSVEKQIVVGGGGRVKLPPEIGFFLSVLVCLS